jgi:hypothetical protein
MSQKQHCCDPAYVQHVLARVYGGFAGKAWCETHGQADTAEALLGLKYSGSYLGFDRVHPKAMPRRLEMACDGRLLQHASHMLAAVFECNYADPRKNCGLASLKEHT